jgi:DNA phosphorothioation-dependent restriction protein DptG
METLQITILELINWTQIMFLNNKIAIKNNTQEMKHRGIALNKNSKKMILKI